MRRRSHDESGSAMVLALGILVVLAVLALIIVAMVSGEKKTETAEYSGARSFYSADAASEAGVNWLVQQSNPPALVDTNSNVEVSNTYTVLANQHLYRYDVQYIGKQFAPGWPVNFKNYRYTVTARGQSAGQSAAAVQVNATRLFKEGY
ncbi:MAG TPA: hypothetical protein VLV15_07580 [Dongiaceae bacterium]|nr:hypothetical protein [Dongiaceae bacterium]